MPQLSQQVSRSSEEISTLTLALLWIHTRSEMASAAPNACRQKNRGVSQTNKYNLGRWDSFIWTEGIRTEGVVRSSMQICGMGLCTISYNGECQILARACVCDLSKSNINPQPQLHMVTSFKQWVFILPSRIHRSPGLWSPSEWDSWATALWRQTLQAASGLRYTEPCRGKQCYRVKYYRVLLQLTTTM